MEKKEQHEIKRLNNILITGTPGVGKTTLAEELAEELDLNCMNVTKVIMEKKCYTKFLKDSGSYELDEDKLLDAIEDEMVEGGQVLDYHSSEFFPERYFCLVVVLRASSDVLYKRLQSRGYSDKKIEENIDAEIFQVCLDEALKSYDNAIVLELPSDSLKDMEDNIKEITKFLS